jgi:hypothetical protein
VIKEIITTPGYISVTPEEFRRIAYPTDKELYACHHKSYLPECIRKEDILSKTYSDRYLSNYYEVIDKPEEISDEYGLDRDILDDIYYTFKLIHYKDAYREGHTDIWVVY